MNFFGSQKEAYIYLFFVVSGRLSQQLPVTHYLQLVSILASVQCLAALPYVLHFPVYEASSSVQTVLANKSYVQTTQHQSVEL